MKRLILTLLLLSLYAFPQSTISGGTVSSTGPITAGHCASFASPTQVQDAGGVCGTGGGVALGTATFIREPRGTVERWP